MTSDRAVMAVLLRQAEWLLADAAHCIPRETFDAEDCGALADVLDRLSVALRRLVGHDTPPSGVHTRQTDR
jgi:hypothetical protein